MRKSAHTEAMSEAPTHTQRAIETTGAIDEAGRLHLDEPLEGAASQSVRVILLFGAEDDIDERAWLRAAGRNPAFDFLRDTAEDVYTSEDGAPFDEKAQRHDER